MKMCIVAIANREGLNKPMHSRNLIRVFTHANLFSKIQRLLCTTQATLIKLRGSEG